MISDSKWLAEEASKIVEVFQDYLADSASALHRISSEMDIDFVELYDIKDKFIEESLGAIKYFIDAIQAEIIHQIKKHGGKPLNYGADVAKELREIVEMPRDEFKKLYPEVKGD
jgi:hypothetical protein